MNTMKPAPRDRLAPLHSPDPPPPGVVTPAAEQAVLELLWSAFAGDPMRHGVWAVDHWVSLNEPPTPDALRGALTGAGPAISALFLNDDSRTHVGAVDVDHEEGWPAVLDIARELALAGVRAYVNGSRR